MQFEEFDWLSGHGITLGSRGYFFLIDTGGSRRSRVNAEEKKILTPRRKKYFIFFSSALTRLRREPSVSIRKNILWNPGYHGM